MWMDKNNQWIYQLPLIYFIIVVTNEIGLSIGLTLVKTCHGQCYLLLIKNIINGYTLVTKSMYFLSQSLFRLCDLKLILCSAIV